MLKKLLWCFVYNHRGSGEDGQLGIGNNEDKEWVCQVKALENYSVSSVVAGSRNSLALCQDGKVFFSFPIFTCTISLWVWSKIHYL